MSGLSVFANIAKYAELALAGVVVAEQTMTQEAGQNKQKVVLDVINQEAQVAGIAVPGIAPSIVNIAVGIANLIGLFQHRPAAVAAGK